MPIVAVNHVTKLTALVQIIFQEILLNVYKFFTRVPLCMPNTETSNVSQVPLTEFTAGTDQTPGTQDHYSPSPSTGSQSLILHRNFKTTLIFKMTLILHTNFTHSLLTLFI